VRRKRALALGGRLQVARRGGAGGRQDMPPNSPIDSPIDNPIDNPIAKSR
jgi:hypothetical protein